MALITSRGDMVFECDVCKRRVRTPHNKYSMDVIQRCVITYSCPGKLHRITQAKDINSTPALTPSVTGLQDWFQRRVLYTHNQTIESTTWLIEHDLGSKPSIQVFEKQIDNGETVYVEISNFTVTTNDLNTVTITFATPTSGIAQCLSYSSQNIINPNLHQPITTNVEDFQISHNGEITIATLDSDILVDITINYKSPIDNSVTPITYSGIDNVAAADSPWVGAFKVYIRGKTYTVRSFNVTNSAIVNGSQMSFSDITAPNDTLILLGVAPFSVPDRVTNRYVDVALLSSVQPEFYYNAGEVYTAPSVIKSVYPLIIAVE